LAVEQTSNLPPLTHNLALPEQKRVTTALENASLKASKEPKSRSMAAARLPVGAPHPFGAITSQNIQWL